MKTVNRLLRTAGVSHVVFVALAAGPALAQSATTQEEESVEGMSPSNEVSEEGTSPDVIVVTALRREQRVQDVPASLTVLDASTIKAKGGQDFRDYLTGVPGVNFTEGNTGAMRVTIRGVSDGIGGTDPLAGIYIDETPITESFYGTLDPDIFDLERVEVLRGPQGTLYGSGSMGGTVRIITKKPKLDVFEGSLATTVSDVAHGGWNRRIDGVINVPVLSDLMALRVSGGYRKDDGWIDNAFTGQEDTNSIEKVNARAQLLLEPTVDTSIIAGFLYQKEDLGAPAYVVAGLPEYQSSYIYRPYGESDAKLASLTLQQDFDKMTLTSATNYLGKDLISASDAGSNILPVIESILQVDLGPTEGVGVRSDTEFKLFTQEVRLASAGINVVDFVLGGFYSDAETSVLQVFDFSQAPSAEVVASGEGFYKSAQSYRTRQIAGFGELTFNVTPEFALTAGLRVFNVEQQNVTDSSGTLNGGASTTLGNSSKTAIQQKYLIEYQPSSDHLIYAQASQGYRNGGPTGNFPVSACADALASLGYTSVPTSYDPDKLWNYEIGSKNTLLDGRMTLNGAAYYIDWTDIQTSLRLSCGFGFVANAGKAVSKGLELETTVEPIRDLIFSGSLAYTDASLKQAAPGAQAEAGDRLPLVSDWSWNASAQYSHAIGANLEALLRGEINHVGNRWNAYESLGPAAALLPAYTSVNTRIGVRGNNWSAAIFATNLFDERILTMQTTGGVPLGLVSKPRTVGITATLDF